MEHFDWFSGAVLPYFNFFVFLGMAYFLFKKPLVAMFAKRRSDFELQLMEARKARDEAEAQQRDVQARYETLAKEIESIKESTREAAQGEADRIGASSRDLVEHIQAEAQRIAAAEVDRARQDLRAVIVQEAQTAVLTRLKSELDATQQAALNNSKFGELSKVCQEYRV